MTPPSKVGPNEIWLARYEDDEERGYYQANDVTYAQLAQFIRKLTIGDATKDSDDYISSWILGNFTGGGQVEEYNEGAEVDRFYVAFAETDASNRNALGPLVSRQRPNSNSVKSYPLDVGNDGIAYHAFKETATWKVWGFKESALDFSYNGGTGVALGGEPVNKAIRFDGVIYVPLGGSGYTRITGSGGTPTCTNVAGSVDPTSASPTSAPRPIAFAVFNQMLWCITAEGGIANHSIALKDAGANAWFWPYATNLNTNFPHIESSATAKAMAVFPDKNGVESLYIKTDRGVIVFDDNNSMFFEQHIDFPPHPDVNQSFAVWPPGGDLHAPIGLNDVKYSTAFVVDPKFGLARDHGLPPELRGAIKDIEPTVDRLYCIVGGVSEVSTSYLYNSQVAASTDDARGLGVDTGNNIYVCDENTERVRKYNSSLVFQSTIIAGGAGTGDGQFSSNNGPYDIAVDGGGNLWAIDRGNSRVQKFSSAGAFVSKFGTFDDGTAAVAGSSTWTLRATHTDSLDTPAQVAVNSAGKIYIADTANNRLDRLNSDGTHDTVISSLTGITGVCVDASDNVYVAYNAGGGLYKVKKYNSSLVLQWTQSGIFNGGMHLATNGTTLWITLPTVAAIGTLDCASGSTQGSFGGAGSGNGQFSSPWGICYSSSELYVVDAGNSRVQVFNTSGTYQRQWAIAAGCRGINVDSAGRVLVAGNGTDLVYRTSSAGVAIDSFAQNDPDGIGIGTTYIYVANAVSDNIAKWEDVVVGSSPATPPADGLFNLPESIDIKTSNGRIYVLDSSNHRVQYFTSSGVYEGKFGSSAYDSGTGAIIASSGAGELNTPTGLAVSQATGDVYVVDAGNDRVNQYTATGTFVRSWGVTGTGNGQFQDPVAVAINPVTDNVFVTDSTRDDVQEFTNTGSFVRTFGGTGSGNGQFNNARGIVFDSSGNAYVSDATDERIQKFTSASGGALTAYPSLHHWTGVGWHGDYRHTTSANVPTFLKAMSADAYRLWFGMDDGYIYYLKLRRTFHNARTGFLAGIDEFSAGGANVSYIETGFFDASMEGFDKIASHLILLDAVATSTETILVEFKCDSGGWETLGTVSASANKTILPFDLISGFSKGRRFNKIALRFTFSRTTGGSTPQFLTPIMDAGTLHFTKIPQNTTSFSLTVPLSKYKDRTAFEQYNDLTALVTTGEFLPLVFRRNSHDSDENEVSATFRVLISAISGLMDTGETGTGSVELSLIAIPTGL